MFRRMINKWKMPIYKHDVLIVILYGFLSALLLGILAGAVNFLFDQINVKVSIGVFLLAYGISFTLKRAYYSYHILYPTLAVIFMIFGLFVTLVSYYCFIFRDIRIILEYLSRLDFYILFFKSPFIYHIAFFKNIFGGSFEAEVFIYMILDTLIYSAGFFIVSKNTIGRN